MNPLCRATSRSCGGGCWPRQERRRAVIAKLHQTVAGFLRTDQTRSWLLAAEGAEVVGSTPKEFAEFIQNETVKWTRVIKAAGIKLD